MKTLFRTLKEYYILITIALTSKVLILLSLGQLSTYFFPNSRSRSLNIWELWNVWDAPHYISIASSGYQAQGIEAYFIVFLPLLPLLIFISKFIFQTNFLVAGYIVSLVSSILLAIMFYKLILLDFSKKTAMFAVFLLFIFPTSFFLHIPYTEPLFILLAASAFYFARKKNYWRAFFLVSLASFTKTAGLALIPAILAEILIFDKENFFKENIFKKIRFLLFGLVLSLSGFLTYLFINYFIYGDILYFTLAEKENWFTTFAPFGQGFVSAYESIFWRQGLDKIMIGYGQIIAFVLGLLMSIFVLIKIRFSYGLYMLLVLWSSSAMSFWLSMPRYIISLFPMFIALALFSENLIFRSIWTLTSTVLLIVLGIIFIQYGPVF